MKNEANLKPNKFTANPYSRGTYSDLRPKTQNGTKPNKANLHQVAATCRGETQRRRMPENAISRNEPNFKQIISTLTQEITKDYNRSSRRDHLRNEPILNPIRTHLNPIRTQYKPKQTQFSARLS